jgi:MtN3 and saliva related transmembrane protein
MTGEEILGFVAGLFITGGFVPQVWRLYKLKSAKEISLPFTTFFLLGTMLWLTYGILFKLQPVVFWNSITLFLGFAMLFAKLKYGKGSAD